MQESENKSVLIPPLPLLPPRSSENTDLFRVKDGPAVIIEIGKNNFQAKIVRCSALTIWSGCWLASPKKKNTIRLNHEL